MCGIAGLMLPSGALPDKKTLDCMSSSLEHRGPDGGGEFLAPGIGLVHRRLSIIDIENGNQPLSHPLGLHLVANGEIYNYIELREEFAAEEFKTRSDCEIPLHLYARLGEHFASRLRGMYSIAIYDERSRTLVLSRDPFGIKPLYYCEGSFGFAFASEPRAFFDAALVEPSLQMDAARELFQLQYSSAAETAFEGVYRVFPGETLIIQSGKILRRERIHALPKGGPVPISVDDALANVETALNDSVMVHQRSDVPYGLFLSGGIDSSALLAQMAKSNHEPIKSYTIGFPGTGVADERDHARSIAAAFGSEHVEIDFTEKDFWDLLPQVVETIDDPIADYAILPTYKLASVASRDVKVILSGEGGDELFGGYGRYRSLAAPWRFFRRPGRLKGALNGLGILRSENEKWRKGREQAMEMARADGRSSLQAEQAVDCNDWLANDLLIKLDRCLMAHGLEGRTPMLDPVVASAVFRFPDKLKVKGKYGKWILRKWLDNQLPNADAFARKKGFTVPVDEWIRGHAEKLGLLVSQQPIITELFHPDVVRKVFCARDKRSGFAAWVLLFFVLWHKVHIERQALFGNVFDVLECSYKN